MITTHLTIKNMCCGRCIIEVKRIFEKIGLLTHQVNLGEVIVETISNYLSAQLNKSYKLLSTVFKQVTGIAIERYFIKLKVEKAKELLILNEIDIAEIAWLLGYSSSQNFSTYFKRETGKTPLEYKNDPIPERIHLPSLIPKNFKQ